MYDAASLLGRVTQEQWDEFVAGKALVSELVKAYKPLIVSFGFRDQVLDILNRSTAEEVLARVEKERPDLRVGDRTQAVARIEAEMRRVEGILKE
ncbi:MAG TPA: hypothetical protein VJ397_07930 [Thermoplasmata archaeon]|nr:hypothetical protein [Thermoplasmata archaeon]